MPLDVAILLKLAPLAIHELQRYRRSDVAKALDRRVQAEFENDPELGPRASEALVNEWLYLHDDPRFAVLVRALVRHGHVAYLDALRIRAGELLAGLETLPMDVPVAVDRLVQAVANNFVAAQKDERDAAQAGTSAVLSAIEPLATEESVASGFAANQAALDRLERELLPAAPRVVLLVSSFSDVVRRHLAELIAHDPAAAGQLGQVLDARGADGLAELVRAPQPWALQQSAVFWQTAGRILAELGRAADAATAYTRESDCADCADRARALIDAARCAEADDALGSAARADEHLAAAQAVDDQHPMVALFCADRIADPVQRLAAIDAVAGRDGHEVARKETARALTLLALRRYQDAHAAAQASIAANPHGGGREAASLATILEAGDRHAIGSRDDRPLMDAVAYQLSLHHEARDSGRMGLAGVAGARAALGTALLGDDAAAVELIDHIAADDAMLAKEEARLLLADAAIVAGDPRRARAVVNAAHDETSESRVRAASVEALTGEDPVAAAETLDALIAEADDADVRRQAVATRILLARDPAVPFDAKIADGLPDGERLVAHTHAARAMAAGDFAAARAAVAHLDDDLSLALRVGIAEADGALPEATALQATLARRQPTAHNLLGLAALRYRAKDHRGAIRDAVRLATDERKMRRARDQAFGLAAQAAIDGGELEELEDLTERWAELSPERQDPLWAHVFALARQNRHREALAFARDRALEPVQDADRHLLWAELLMEGSATGAERMRDLMELSDRFGRPMELERAFIGGVLRTPVPERGEDDPEVVARFQEAIGTFQKRFPQAGGLQQITIDEDEDPAVLLEKLATVQQPPTAEQRAAVDDAVAGVRQGRTPVAVVAAMVGRGTIEVLLQNQAHPLAVFDQETGQAEIAAAEQALDQAGASWDETAFATVAELSEDAAQRILGLLPGSQVGRAVRDAIAEAVALQPGGEQVGGVQVLPGGTPRFVAADQAMVAHIRDVQQTADGLAARFAVTPDRSDSPDDDELAAMVARGRGRGPLAALASTFLTARTRSLPVFSDDRVVRAYARALGLSAFGTIALVDAAHRRGIVSRAERADVLVEILELGIWSPALEPEVYVGVARQAGFDPARCARALLADEAMLRNDPRFTHNALLLTMVAIEAPGQLDAWAEAVVDGYAEILQIERVVSASLLVAAHLDPDAEQVGEDVRKRTTRVVAALRRAARRDEARPDTDPLVVGVGRWLRQADGPQERAAVLERLLGQVDPADVAGLRAVLGREQ